MAKHDRSLIESVRADVTARWHKQVERFPIMRHEIPLALYVRRNLRAAMRNARRRLIHDG